MAHIPASLTRIPYLALNATNRRLSTLFLPSHKRTWEIYGLSHKLSTKTAPNNLTVNHATHKNRFPQSALRHLFGSLAHIPTKNLQKPPLTA